MASQRDIELEKRRIIEQSPVVEAPKVSEKAVSNSIEIKAPMVGTFYRAPQPEAPPYAEVGQIIEAGQVICIIEAMKLMNEIESEYDGLVKERLLENAQPVEFGQTLFVVEPA